MDGTTFAVAGILAVGVAVASAATAAADPAAEPLPPPGPTVPFLGPLGPQGPGLLPQLLGQNPVPSLPNGVPGELPNLEPFNNAYLLPQNEAPSLPGAGTEVGVPPGDENADLGRIAYLRQLHELHENGNLRGALLGQLPPPAG